MIASREMPKYKSHKLVWALKIESIQHLPNPDPTGQSVAASYGAIITPEDEGYGPFKVSAEYCVKHSPQAGGYFVQYQDGYQSFSPPNAFEEGYSLQEDEAAQPSIERPAAEEAAPRITPENIEANIASEHYFTAADGARMSPEGNHPIHNLSTGSLGLLTFCVLVLKNGFTVTGESACVSPENFDVELGRKIARQNAVAKVWPLMGYALKEKLADAAPHEGSKDITNQVDGAVSAWLMAQPEFSVASG